MVEMGILQSTTLYLLVYLLSAILLSLKKNISFNKKPLTSFFVFIAMLPPVLLAAYRYNVGTDYFNYFYMYLWAGSHSMFEIVNNYSLFGSTPLGIIIIAKIATFFDSYVIYYGILSLLIYVPFLIVVTKYWDTKITPLVSFFFLMTSFSGGLNIIKQSIAISFFLLSLQYVFERNFIKFIIIALIAILFHPTAIIILPTYFLIDNDYTLISKRKKVLVVILSFVLLLVFDNFLSMIGGRWESYSSTYKATSNLIFYKNLLLFVIFVFFHKKLIKMDIKNDLFIILFTIGTILSFLGFWNLYLKRIASYFTVVQILIMCQIPFLFSNRFSRNSILVLLILYMLFMFVYSYSVLGQTGIIPYRYLS